jgi:hypothetical protein
LGLGRRVEGEGFRVQGLGVKGQEFWFGVKGSGLGFRVWVQGVVRKVQHRVICIVEAHRLFLLNFPCLLGRPRGRPLCDVEGACGGVLQLSCRPGDHAGAGPSSFEKLELNNITVISSHFSVLVPILEVALECLVYAHSLSLAGLA